LIKVLQKVMRDSKGWNPLSRLGGGVKGADRL